MVVKSIGLWMERYGFKFLLLARSFCGLERITQLLAKFLTCYLWRAIAHKVADDYGKCKILIPMFNMQ